MRHTGAWSGSALAGGASTATAAKQAAKPRRVARPASAAGARRELPPYLGGGSIQDAQLQASRARSLAAVRASGPAAYATHPPPSSGGWGAAPALPHGMHSGVDATVRMVFEKYDANGSGASLAPTPLRAAD